MQKCVFMLAAVAALVIANPAHAAPWSFDPERYLTSWSDEARCSASVRHTSLALDPEMTGSVSPQPADSDPALFERGEDL